MWYTNLTDSRKPSPIACLDRGSDYHGGVATSAPPDMESIAGLMRQSGCVVLREAATLVSQLYTRLLEPTGLSVTEAGILRICASRRSASVSTLAHDLATPTQIIRGHLKPLVERNLVEWISSAKRAPGRRIQLTPAGRQKLLLAIACWDRAQGMLRERLGDQRWRQLTAALGDLIALVSEPA